MNGSRYSVLGLGRARSRWFGDVALWTTSGAVPAEFLKCLSVAEARHRLSSLQPYSALIVESGIPGLDRDLIDLARQAGTPTFVIASRTDNAEQWTALGATAVLPTDLTPALLLDALVSHATLTAVRQPRAAALADPLTLSTGRLIAVCGPGGTGASTIAIALAQGIADDVTEADHVALADLARNGEQAMLHDSPDIVPGIEELVELHRHRRPSVSEVRNLTFDVANRGYRLLLGQRRPAAWAAMSPASSASSVSSLQHAFRTTIADITADFEGEAQGGSLDVEERNALSRHCLLNADLVIAVGLPGMKGLHSLTRLLRDIATYEVDPERVLPVVNRMPKRGTARATATRAVATLSRDGTELATAHAPVFLPDRPVDDVLRAGDRLPKQLVDPLTAAVVATLSRSQPRNSFELLGEEPQSVTPGSLGIGTFLDEAIGE